MSTREPLASVHRLQKVRSGAVSGAILLSLYSFDRLATLCGGYVRRNLNARDIPAAKSVKWEKT
jgi:hypothetical protein